MDFLSPFCLFPLISGFIYSISALLMKRALDLGIDAWRSSIIVNAGMAIPAMAMLFFDSEKQPGAEIWMLVVPALAFVSGVIFNSFALRVGDVSIATPVLGTKVMFVAIFTVILSDAYVPGAVWVGAIFVVLGLGLLRGGGGGTRRGFWQTVFFAILSANSFALCDILFMKYASIWGFSRFIPMVFGLVAVMAVAMLPFLPKPKERISSQAITWTCAASILNGFQSTGIAVSLSLWAGGATAVNIIYSSRSIWSIIIIWTVGHWFGNMENAHGWKVMLARLGGSALLIVAIILALLYQPK